jgi:four helix bundle protein
MMNGESGEAFEPSRDLRKRTKAFALRIIRLCASLPDTPEGRLIRWQLLKSGTSPGAHYREAYRARSVAEFVSKMGGGNQELEETAYWLELLVEAKIVAAKRLEGLMKETDELIAIFTSSIKTANANK